MKQKYTNDEIARLVRIGFCQPKFYTQATWKKAKTLMFLACEMNIGVIYKPHRNKGHFWIESETAIGICDVTTELIKKYGNPEMEVI